MLLLLRFFRSLLGFGLPFTTMLDSFRMSTSGVATVSIRVSFGLKVVFLATLFFFLVEDLVLIYFYKTVLLSKFDSLTGFCQGYFT
jgi:hypothetical protein